MKTKLVNTTGHWKVHLRVGLLCMVLFLSVIPAGTVLGHASLLGSTPADGDQLDSAPTELVLEFSEPVGIVDGGTTLHGAGSDPLELSPQALGNNVIVPLDDLGDGSYIVQWRVISADSHPISGTVSFSVGDAISGDTPTPGTEVPGWIDLGRTVAVAIKYLGLLTSSGLLLTGWVIVRNDISLANRMALRFAWVGLAGIILEIPFVAMIQSGQVSTSFAHLRTAISALDSNILTAGLIGAIFVGLALVTEWLPLGASNRWRAGTTLLVASALTLVLSGHSRTRDPFWLTMTADALHVLVAAVWLGGIILLTLGLTGRWRGDSFSNGDRAADAVSRFSTIAGYTSALVILSGVLLALTILDSINALIHTDYGRTLLLKVGLVGLVIVLAALNRFRFIPMISVARLDAMTWLRRLVSLELILLVAVVGVTGSLVHLDPNVRAEQGTPEAVVLYDGESALDADHSVHLVIEQAVGGELEVTAQILDDQGTIIAPEADLELHWSLPAQDLGPITQTVEIDAGSGWFTATVSLPAAGEWELEVRANIDRFTDSRSTIVVVIPD